MSWFEDPEDSHLPEWALNDLVRRTVPRTTAFCWLLHLGLCSSCQRRLEALHGAEGREFLDQALPSHCDRDAALSALFPRPTRSEDYAEAVRRAIASATQVQRRVLSEEAEAVALYRRLAGQPAGRWSLVIQNQNRYQTLGMMSLVLREARRHWRSDPSRAESLARLALDIHALLCETRYGPRLLRDRAVLAWGYLANSLRAQRCLPEADRALRRGERLLPKNEREALDETAWTRLFRASLDRDRRRFESALMAARAARRLFYGIRDRTQTALSEMLVAEILAELDRGEEGASALERLVSRSSPEEIGEPMYFAAIQHLINALAKLGRGAEAFRWMQRLQEVSAVYPEPGNQTRIRWSEALVYQALGDLERATQLLREVRRDFVECDRGYDAAVATLDLAGLLLERGESGEAQALAEEMTPIFQSLQIERETLAAVLLFVESLRQEQATAAAARVAASRLKSAKQLPARS